MVAAALLAAGAMVGCVEPEVESPEHSIIPLPASVEWVRTDTFHLSDSTRITFDAGYEEAERIGVFLSTLIGNDAETRPVVEAHSDSLAQQTISLTREGASESLGPEGYELDVTASMITVRATDAAGLFYGVQTLRQMLPPAVEYAGAFPRPLFVPAGHIKDTPRFAWRGLMLDVARHFLDVDDVKRFVDLAALYKINRLHLHLSDDQGWRIEIPGWPNLTAHGGSTEVGGGEGGYYTTEQYSEIVAYAQEHFVTVVPEIDMPGHTNAALASYPELNCDRVARDLYTGTAVGFSALCVDSEATYTFLDDVIREISLLTPGPYFHVGGDEVERLTEEEYGAFIGGVQAMVQRHGKRMVGWDEVVLADLQPGSLVQLWRPNWPVPGAEVDSAQAARSAEFEAAVLSAIQSGATVILSPANRVYLDLKYDSATVLGLTWAGIPNVRDAYDWKVSELYGSIPEEAIAGIEAPLWSETVATAEDFEYMAFPRLVGVAELGWSSEANTNWSEYRLRLGAQLARWTALGVNFNRSALVPWS